MIYQENIFDIRIYVCLMGTSEEQRLRLSVDETYDGGYPINRDYDQPFYKPNNRQVFTNHREMRAGKLKTTEQHHDLLDAQYPYEEVIAHVGNGNLLANFGFVAWQNDRLFCLADEPVFRSSYICIVAWKDSRITVETLWFGRENGNVFVSRKVDNGVETISDKIDFATSGQGLMSCGTPVPLEQIAEQWYDTRHLVTPLPMTANGSTLFVPNCQLQQGLLRKALREPVRIRLETCVDEQTTIPLSVSGWLKLKDFPRKLYKAKEFLKQHGILDQEPSADQRNLIEEIGKRMFTLFNQALNATNYSVVQGSQPLKEGQFRFINGYVGEIFFKKALYPHNVFVRWPDGSCGFVLFPGKSGLSGTTLDDAQEVLKALNVEDAVLLDNGGDVQLWANGQCIVASSEQRNELRSLLAVMASRDSENQYPPRSDNRSRTAVCEISSA